VPCEPLYKADRSFATVLVGLKHRDSKMVAALFFPQLFHLIDQPVDRIELLQRVVLIVLYGSHFGDQLSEEPIGRRAIVMAVAHFSAWHGGSIIEGVVKYVLSRGVRDWFALTFPTLAAYPADKWMMAPIVFFLSIGVLAGVGVAAFENPNQMCEVCHDTMMKRFDAYTCSGKESLPDKELAACRRSLGKPEIY
jgi:hypothetical protein